MTHSQKQRIGFKWMSSSKAKQNGQRIWAQSTGTLWNMALRSNSVHVSRGREKFCVGSLPTAEV